MTGQGYSLLPDFVVPEDIMENRLVRLMPDYDPVAQPIFAFFAQRRHTPQKIRVFVDFLAAAFGDREI